MSPPRLWSWRLGYGALTHISQSTILKHGVISARLTPSLRPTSMKLRWRSCFENNCSQFQVFVLVVLSKAFSYRPRNAHSLLSLLLRPTSLYRYLSSAPLSQSTATSISVLQLTRAECECAE